MSNPDTLFWTACIPSRIVIASLPLVIPQGLLKPLGYVLATVSLAFFILWTFNLRLDAVEAGGKGTWWHQWRIVHAILYALAAVALLSQNRAAWVPLAADVIVAVVAKHVSDV